MSNGAHSANLGPLPGMLPKNIARMRRATFFVLVLLGTILGTWLLAVFLTGGGSGAGG